MKAMRDAVDLTGISRVRRDELPPSPVAGRPRLLVEVARERLLGSERWPAEQLAPRREVDEVQDLGSVRRVEADEQALVLEDDHGTASCL